MVILSVSAYKSELEDEIKQKKTDEEIKIEERKEILEVLEK